MKGKEMDLIITVLKVGGDFQMRIKHRKVIWNCLKLLSFSMSKDTELYSNAYLLNISKIVTYIIQCS